MRGCFAATNPAAKQVPGAERSAKMTLNAFKTGSFRAFALRTRRGLSPGRNVRRYRVLTKSNTTCFPLGMTEIYGE
jgi:hypothetical protein